MPNQHSGGAASLEGVDLVYVTRNGLGDITGFQDKDAVPIDRHEFAWANFVLEDPTDYPAGTCVQIEDRHMDSRGTGQVRFVAGSSWVLDSRWIYFATQASAPAAASWPGLRIWAADYGSYGAELISNGTDYIQADSEVLIHKDNLISKVLVCPAAQASGAPTDAGGGIVNIPITAHGISTPSGASFYVTTTANGWIAGEWLPISSIPDANNVRVTHSFSGITGAPTLALVGVYVPMESITIPALGPNSDIAIDITNVYTNSANDKNFLVKLGGTTLYAPTMITALALGATRQLLLISNRNSKSAQIAGIGSTTAMGNGATSAVPSTASINTTSGTTLEMGYNMETANERAWIERYSVYTRK